MFANIEFQAFKSFSMKKKGKSNSTKWYKWFTKIIAFPKFKSRGLVNEFSMPSVRYIVNRSKFEVVKNKD